MSCLGVHFALTEEQVAALKSGKNERERLAFMQEQLEPYFFDEAPEWKAESDKAWDAIHRTLTDGKLAYDNGTYPLDHVILAGEQLYASGDYIMSLKSPAQVKDMAVALDQVTQAAFRQRYYSIDENDYGLELSAEDFEYSWDWFCGIKDLLRRAAENDRYILFTADQ